MINLLSLILCAVTLALMTTFFVLFLVSSAKRKRQICAADEKIAELQKEHAAFLKTTKDMIEKLLNEVKNDNVSLYEKIKNELSAILKEIKAPLA